MTSCKGLSRHMSVRECESGQDSKKNHGRWYDFGQCNILHILECIQHRPRKLMLVLTSEDVAMIAPHRAVSWIQIIG